MCSSDLGTFGDPFLAAGLQQRGVGAFLFGHRLDQGDLVFEYLVVKAGFFDLFGHFTHAGHHAHHALHAAHLEHLFELHFQVVHIELTLGHAAHHLFGLFGLDGFLRLFDEGDDVTHAKDAARDAFGFKGFERVHLFAKADEFDRLAGDRAHGQGCTAATVTVHTRQHDAGNADAVVEVFSRLHSVLAGQAIDHQQGFARVGNVTDGFDLLHQFFVDGQTASGVEHVDVVAAHCGLGLGAFGDLDGVFTLDDGQGVDADLHAEDRKLFRDAMDRLGIENPRATIVTAPKFENGKADLNEGVRIALESLEDIGLPAIIRPAFTMGGTGGGVAYNRADYEHFCRTGMDASPVNQILVDESLLGWKEFEMEVVRDKADNAIIVCAIENFDAMGVHTGDSITVAPAQTLSDREYQLMRNASIATLREIGVDTGGSNVQFAINPRDGRMIVIEMNPRVSRSSALASKATGFPIAKIAAKLAVGYTLDELDNDITKITKACFEPTIDYCVVKFPRWA